jgi:hypothetical protein
MAGGGSTAIQSILPSRSRPQLGNRIEICRGSPFGSQSLTGIARLHRLRNNPKLAGVSAVWPFETGWAAKAKWLQAHVLVLYAEIYPGVRDPLPDEIKDRGQVRAMWQWACDLDRDNLLWREFCRPIEVETGRL